MCSSLRYRWHVITTISLQSNLLSVSFKMHNCKQKEWLSGKLLDVVGVSSNNTRHSEREKRKDSSFLVPGPLRAAGSGRRPGGPLRRRRASPRARALGHAAMLRAALRGPGRAALGVGGWVAVAAAPPSGGRELGEVRPGGGGGQGKLGRAVVTSAAASRFRWRTVQSAAGSARPAAACASQSAARQPRVTSVASRLPHSLSLIRPGQHGPAGSMLAAWPG